MKFLETVSFVFQADAKLKCERLEAELRSKMEQLEESKRRLVS